MKTKHKVSVLHRAKIASRKISPRHVAKQLRTMQTMRKFADDLGLIYFGSVSQRESEKRHINGITTSNSHFDRHLVVGSFKGYNVSMAVRRDSTPHSGGVTDYAWTILSVELHDRSSVSPLQVLNGSMAKLHDAKFSSLVDIPLDYTSPEVTDFLRHYKIYGKLANRAHINYLLTPEFLYSFAAQSVGRVSIEVSAGMVYVYLDEKYPRRNDLSKVVNLGVWLAQTIDAGVE